MTLYNMPPEEYVGFVFAISAPTIVAVEYTAGVASAESLIKISVGAFGVLLTTIAYRWYRLQNTR